MTDYQTVLDHAMILSEQERADLVSALVHSLAQRNGGLPSEEWWTQWVAECERRLERYECGETRGVPWRDSMRRVREAVATQRTAQE